jgi:hypothetical protein
MNAIPPTSGTGQWTRVSGPNTPTVTNPLSPTTTITGTVTGTYVYRWTTSNGVICASSTDDITIVNRVPIALSGLSSATICVGGQQTLSVTPTGGSGVFNYQWQYRNSGVWQNVGINSNTYTTPVLNTAGNYLYHVIVSDQAAALNGGCSTTSIDATITVVNDPVVTLLTNDTLSVCYDGYETFSVSLVGGTGAYTYQWQYYDVFTSTYYDVVNGTPCGAIYTNSTTPSLTVGGMFCPGYLRYRVVVTPVEPSCGPITPVEVVLVVQPDPSIFAQPFVHTR